MMLGLSLSAFTILHVIISLIAIVAGLVVMFAMLGSNAMPGLTAIFLLFTILTSVTGFLFPFTQLLPSAFSRSCCWRSHASRSTSCTLPAPGAGSIW